MRSSKLFLFGIIIIALTLSVKYVNSQKITINIPNNGTTDLNTYLDDLRVVASSVQYSAALNVKLVSDLEAHLANNRVHCSDQQSNTQQNLPTRISSSSSNNLSKVILVNVHLPWNEARKYCTNLGMKFANIDTPDKLEKAARELELLQEEVYNTSGTQEDILQTSSEVLFLHVGLHSLFGENEWLDINNQPLNPYQLSIGKSLFSKTNLFNSKCGVFTNNREFASVNCEEDYRFLCESSDL